VDPFVLIPHLWEEKILEKFSTSLLAGYHQHCLSAIAGGRAADFTFSAFPNLQWLWRAFCGVPPRVAPRPVPFYGDIRTRFNYYYPRVSYWEGPNCCVTDRACIDFAFYTLLGEPEITVIDSFCEIHVFGVLESPPGSSLDKFLNECRFSRFPQPSVGFFRKDQIQEVLKDTDALIRKFFAGVGAMVSALEKQD
jgi:hypothetical protein